MRRQRVRPSRRALVLVRRRRHGLRRPRRLRLGSRRRLPPGNASGSSSGRRRGCCVCVCSCVSSQGCLRRSCCACGCCGSCPSRSETGRQRQEQGAPSRLRPTLLATRARRRTWRCGRTAEARRRAACGGGSSTSETSAILRHLYAYFGHAFTRSLHCSRTVEALSPSAACVGNCWCDARLHVVTRQPRMNPPRGYCSTRVHLRNCGPVTGTASPHASMDEMCHCRGRAR